MNFDIPTGARIVIITPGEYSKSSISGRVGLGGVVLQNLENKLKAPTLSNNLATYCLLN